MSKPSGWTLGLKCLANETLWVGDQLGRVSRACPFVGHLETIVSPVKDLLWFLLIPLVLLNLENKLTCYATPGWVLGWVGGGG